MYFHLLFLILINIFQYFLLLLKHFHIKIKYKFNFNYDNIENDSKDSFIPRQTDEMVRYASKKLIPFIKYMKENKYMGVPEIINEIGNVSNEGYQSSLK